MNQALVLLLSSSNEEVAVVSGRVDCDANTYSNAV